MTPAQLQTIKAAILAETNPTFVAHRQAGNTGLMADWLNDLSNTDAWMAAADARTMFESMDITKFDALTGGKRDAWRLMMDYAPINFGRNKMRSGVQDVWGVTDSVAVLQALREKARRIEVVLGGTVKTTNTVAALDRAYVGTIQDADVVAAINAA